MPRILRPASRRPSCSRRAVPLAISRRRAWPRATGDRSGASCGSIIRPIRKWRIPWPPIWPPRVARGAIEAGQVPPPASRPRSRRLLFRHPGAGVGRWALTVAAPPSRATRRRAGDSRARRRRRQPNRPMATARQHLISRAGPQRISRAGPQQISRAGLHQISRASLHRCNPSSCRASGAWSDPARRAGRDRSCPVPTRASRTIRVPKLLRERRHPPSSRRSTQPGCAALETHRSTGRARGLLLPATTGPRRMSQAAQPPRTMPARHRSVPTRHRRVRAPGRQWTRRRRVPRPKMRRRATPSNQTPSTRTRAARVLVRRRPPGARSVLVRDHQCDKPHQSTGRRRIRPTRPV